MTALRSRRNCFLNIGAMSRFLFAAVIICFHAAHVLARPSEDERVRLWKLHNTWPPNWQNETEGYLATQEAREQEIMELTGADERWENGMQYVQTRMVPRFTELGFEITETPPELQEKLLAAVNEGLERWEDLELEDGGGAIYGDLSPKFIEIGNLGWDVAREVKHFHEEWAGGIKLRPTSAYGIRLYQNGSSLVMHHDKIETHVISSIVHIAHEYDDDNEPWPIQIEDHFGRMHSVNLEPGQMLFYESAKCLHGRMKQFRGKYYASIFIHYQPVDRKIWNFDVEEVIASVPPHWNEGILEDHGSRWAGQGITVDSVIPKGAPPRIIQGEYVHDVVSPHAHYENEYDTGEL